MGSTRRIAAFAVASVVRGPLGSSGAPRQLIVTRSARYASILEPLRHAATNASACGATVADELAGAFGAVGAFEPRVGAFAEHAIANAMIADEIRSSMPGCSATDMPQRRYAFRTRTSSANQDTVAAMGLPWNTVVGVVASVREPDLDQPWQTKSPTQARSAGVVIGPGLVLCAANTIANAVSIRVRLAGGDEVVTARVRAVSHDRDHALLEVDAVRGIAHVELAELPQLGDEVAIAGFADDAPSVVRGVVSSIDVVRHSHSQRHLLALAVDVNVDEVIGFGPTFHGSKLAGVVIQKVNDKRVCEIVPAPLVRAFLDGVRQGRSVVVPALGIATQNLENAMLRRSLGVEHGVVVTHVDHGGSADHKLERDDVLVAIDGMTITNAGHVRYADVHPIRFDAIVGERHVGDRVLLAVRRAGRGITVELELKPWLPLVARSTYDTVPRYFVYGGLVFQPLTRDYLTTWDEWWNHAPKEFLHFYYLGQRTAAQHEIVILTQILADELTEGYGHLYNEAVARVNGRVPVDFAAFVEQLRSAVGSVRIETTSGGIIVLDAGSIARARDRILAAHGIPREQG